MKKRYRVYTTPDDGTGYLEDTLKGISDAGERVISVIWRPGQDTKRGGWQPGQYVIVSEFEDQYT